MAKLRIDRKGYWRKAHDRRTKTGQTIHVKRSWVPRDRFLTQDRGAPGRTPPEKQWYQPKGTLYGWQKDLLASQRRATLTRAVNKDGYATTIRKLNALKNVSTDRETDKAVKMDMNFLQRKYRPTGMGSWRK